MPSRKRSKSRGKRSKSRSRRRSKSRGRQSKSRSRGRRSKSRSRKSRSGYGGMHKSENRKYMNAWELSDVAGYWGINLYRDGVSNAQKDILKALRRKGVPETFYLRMKNGKRNRP